jgi:hypothetical protein
MSGKQSPPRHTIQRSAAKEFAFETRVWSPWARANVSVEALLREADGSMTTQQAVTVQFINKE